MAAVIANLFSTGRRLYARSGLKHLTPLHQALKKGALWGTMQLAAVRGLQFPTRWDWHARTEFLLGLYELEIVQLCRRIIRPGWNVIDVGANAGYYARLFSRLAGPQGNVYAFEPHPDLFELLKGNVRNLHNVVIDSRAVADGTGEIAFYGSYRTRSHSLYLSEHTVARYMVRSTSLDDFVAERGNPPIHLVKVDVEGGEPRVLEGMTRLIGSATDLLLIVELSPTNLRLGGTTPAHFLGTLKRLGLAMFSIGRGGIPSPSDPSALLDGLEGGSTNILCVKGRAEWN